jgi:hypothetical protein
MPSRYRPDQVVCSNSDCQRRRRTAYHLQKRRDDPAYRAQCHDSQKQWREEHPEYMRAYRRGHGRSAPEPTASADAIGRLLDQVKNNVAFDLNSCRASIWLISSDERVKNIVATAELIVIQWLSVDE